MMGRSCAVVSVKLTDLRSVQRVWLPGPASFPFLITNTSLKGDKLAKPNFQYEKRQKELEKKRKKEEKTQQKLNKTQPQENPDQPSEEGGANPPPAE
ncbi:MAG: hypothetical protein Q8J61_07250 [Sulfuricella sp.]|nr:hypothetical protein [Sulfuricella sp.]